MPQHLATDPLVPLAYRDKEPNGIEYAPQADTVDYREKRRGSVAVLRGIFAV